MHCSRSWVLEYFTSRCNIGNFFALIVSCMKEVISTACYRTCVFCLFAFEQRVHQRHLAAFTFLRVFLF